LVVVREEVILQLERVLLAVQVVVDMVFLMELIRAEQELQDKAMLALKGIPTIVLLPIQVAEAVRVV
jgi:hypothetical protein